MRWFSLILVILAAFLWGALDGLRDRRAHPDPDDRADLTMMWLKAAFVAGILAGAASWLVGILFDIAITNGGLFFEVTSGAAFTVLLVFVPATIAVALGRFLAGRGASRSAEDHVAYPREADLEVEEQAAESYAGSEWSYEHGHGADNGDNSDNTDTEVFTRIQPDAKPDGAHRAEQ